MFIGSRNRLVHRLTLRGGTASRARTQGAASGMYCFRFRVSGLPTRTGNTSSVNRAAARSRDSADKAERRRPPKRAPAEPLKHTVRVAFPELLTL
jgi:hypothetical protein